jgi:hypothetical protein
MVSQLRQTRRTRERGQAAVELALVLPLFMLFILAIVAFGRTIYTHLAVITAAGDCATLAAQSTNPYHAIAQGNIARERSLANFNVSQQVTTAGIVAYGGQSSHGVTTPDRYACQVGYPVEDNLSNLLPGQVFPVQLFSLQYTFTFAGQPYKSNWEAVP